jgi:peptidoglycan/LPS O-acetylase OafA/YrhL
MLPPRSLDRLRSSLDDANVADSNPRPTEEPRVDASGAAHPLAGGRIDVVDGLRGVAILMVIFRHVFFDSAAKPGWHMAFFADIPVFPFTHLSNTWMGVNLFFVDSGFVLFLPFALGRRAIAAPRDVAELYLRRGFRLLPLYYLMLAVCLVLDRTVLHVIRDPWFEIPAYLTFTFPFFKETFQPRPNGTLWSIGVEVWFSLAFPFLVLLARRIGVLRFVALGIVVALGTRTLAYGFGLGTQTTKTLNTLADSLLGRMDDFALGMGAAALFASGWRAIGPAVGAFAAFVLFTASAWLWDRDLIAGPVTPEVAVGAYFMANVAFFLLLVAALQSRGALRWLLSFTPLRLAGIGCYSLYLVHAPLTWFLDRAPRAVAVPLYLATTALLSFATYRLVEKPAMRLGQRVAARFHAERERRAAVV